MSKYPEHDKLTKVADRSQACGEFLEWLGECRHLHICEFHHEDNNGEPRWIPYDEAVFRAHKMHDGFMFSDLRTIDGEKMMTNPEYESWPEHFSPARLSIRDLLAEHFAIDQDKLEAEKRAMLDTQRKLNDLVYGAES